MSEAQVGTIHDLLAECIACAGVFDVSTDYEADMADLENATQAVLDHVQTLRDERDRLAELVRQAQPHVCSLLCPSVKARHELWTHTKLCLNMQAALTPAGGGQDEK